MIMCESVSHNVDPRATAADLTVPTIVDGYRVDVHMCADCAASLFDAQDAVKAALAAVKSAASALDVMYAKIR